VNIIQDYIKPNIVESRQYQLNIAKSASNSNTLVVLPTGLGKTIIALIIIAKELKKENNKILFLAPTKPLVIQHSQFLKQLLDIDPESIIVFTGEIAPEKRKKMWEKSRIIVSTPQVIENDLLSKRLDLKNVSFIIFDECHHAVGEYSYVFVSEMYQKQRENGLVLAMTASPGNDINKIYEVCKNLSINNIEIRTKYDKDVKPYVHDIKITWQEIPLPNEFAHTIQILRKALSERLKLLKNLEFIESSSVSLINKTKLLDAQKRIQSEIRARIKPPKILFKAASTQSEAMKIHYALELLQTQGVNAFNNFFQRMGKEAISKDSSKASRSIMSDKNILDAIAYAKFLKIEHPKVQKIADIVENQLRNKPNSKIIVFTHYRDTSIHINKILNDVKFAKPARFIGQTVREGDKGLTQKEQSEIIKKFKEEEYNVLIATSVAEEGLDIPSTDLVVFYEPIPSEIRVIQRRGRTARKMAGKVIILITKGTPDEAYYWAAKRKEKRMISELELIRSKLNKKLENTESFFNKKMEIKQNQMTLIDYEKKKEDIKMLVIIFYHQESVLKEKK